MKKAFITLALLLYTHIALGSESYLIRAEIRSADILVGKPNIIVAPGEKASIELKESYRLNLILNKSEEDAVFISIDLQGKDNIKKTRQLVELGKPNSLASGNTRLSFSIRQIGNQ